MNEDLQQIITIFLESNGYDGLYNEAGECGCKIGDLFACGQPGALCKAGYLQPCRCAEDHDYHIEANLTTNDGAKVEE